MILMDPIKGQSATHYPPWTVTNGVKFDHDPGGRTEIRHPFASAELIRAENVQSPREKLILTDGHREGLLQAEANVHQVDRLGTEITKEGRVRSDFVLVHTEHFGEDGP